MLWNQPNVQQVPRRMSTWRDKPLTQVGYRTPRTGGVWTDEPNCVRMIAHWLWRWVTSADVRADLPRYLEHCGLWTGYHGAVGYSTITECLAHAMDRWREDLYVTSTSNGPVEGNVSEYSSVHGVNLSAAAWSVADFLREQGVIEEGGKLLGNSNGWYLDVEGLDAWVASRLLELRDAP